MWGRERWHASRCGILARMEANDLITVDPEILGGAPVFKGTRVPVETLLPVAIPRLLAYHMPPCLRLHPVLS